MWNLLINANWEILVFSKDTGQRLEFLLPANTEGVPLLEGGCLPASWGVRVPGKGQCWPGAPCATESFALQQTSLLLPIVSPGQCGFSPVLICEERDIWCIVSKLVLALGFIWDCQKEGLQRSSYTASNKWFRNRCVPMCIEIYIKKNHTCCLTMRHKLNTVCLEEKSTTKVAPLQKKDLKMNCFEVKEKRSLQK